MLRAAAFFRHTQIVLMDLMLSLIKMYEFMFFMFQLKKPQRTEQQYYALSAAVCVAASLIMTGGGRAGAAILSNIILCYL